MFGKSYQLFQGIYLVKSLSYLKWLAVDALILQVHCQPIFVWIHALQALAQALVKYLLRYLSSTCQAPFTHSWATRASPPSTSVLDAVNDHYTVLDSLRTSTRSLTLKKSIAFSQVLNSNCSCSLASLESLVKVHGFDLSLCSMFIRLNDSWNSLLVGTE